MNNKAFRKKFDQKPWGNWKYTVKNDALWWFGEKIVWEFDTVATALRVLGYMNARKDTQEHDLKDLAQAFSEILGCPRLADAYNTSYNRKGEFVRKAISEDFSICIQCKNRFICWTLLDNKQPSFS